VVFSFSQSLSNQGYLLTFGLNALCAEGLLFGAPEELGGAPEAGRASGSLVRGSAADERGVSIGEGTDGRR
jgi:hypothetical protein